MSLGEHDFRPYPGLRSFEPDEDYLFFGRDRHLDELLERLQTTRFLAVVGTSGSGKSSLVKSGLVPSLFGGYMTEAGSSWRVSISRPQEDPVGRLAWALADSSVLGDEIQVGLTASEASADDADPDDAAWEAGELELHRARATVLETTLSRGPHGLVDVLRQAHLPDYECLLVLIDQFEEIFRFKNSQRRGARRSAYDFIQLLLQAAEQRELPIYVVLTMRSDFIGNCTELPGLAEAINRGQYLVPRMTREERRQAIVSPARVGGAEMSPRLVTRLLNDVGDDPDQLPVLQHALMRTWTFWHGVRRDDEPIDLRHYESIGGLEDALSRHADEAFDELPDRRHRELCEQLFRALTERSAEGQGVRRPLRIGDALRLLEADLGELERVAAPFRRRDRSFLMPPPEAPLDEDTILDISHESLMRNWDKLIAWVDQEARSAQLYRELARDAQLFDRGEVSLWNGPRLQLAEAWREEAAPTLLWAERYHPAFEKAMEFLDAGIDARRRAEEEERRRRERELRRARWFVAVLGVSFLFALLLAVFAYEAKEEAELATEHARAAETEQRAATDRALAAQKESQQLNERLLSTNQELDRALGDLTSMNEELAEKTDLATRNAARAERSAAEIAEQRDRIDRERRVADRLRLEAEQLRDQTLTANKNLEIEQERTRDLAMQTLAGELALQSMRQVDDRDRAALLARQAWLLHRDHGDPAQHAVVDLALRQALARFGAEQTVVEGPERAIRAVDVSLGDRLIAAGDEGGTVWILPQAALTASPQARPIRRRAGVGEIRALSFDSSGRLLVGGIDGRIASWERPESDSAVRATRLCPEAEPCGVLRDLAIQPLGPLAAAVTARPEEGGGVLLVWDRLTDKGEGDILRVAVDDRLTSVAFSPDGRSLAIGGADGPRIYAAVQDAFTGAAPRLLTGGEPTRSLAWSSGGRWLVAGLEDGGLRIRQAPFDDPPRRIAAHRSAITDLDIESGLLATSGLDGRVLLWSLDTLFGSSAPAPTVLGGERQGWVWSTSLSTNGERVVYGGADRRIHLSTTDSLLLAERVCEVVSRSLSDSEREKFLTALDEQAPICPPRPAAPSPSDDEPLSDDEDRDR